MNKGNVYENFAVAFHMLMINGANCFIVQGQMG